MKKKKKKKIPEIAGYIIQIFHNKEKCWVSQDKFYTWRTNADLNQELFEQYGAKARVRPVKFWTGR